MFIKKRWTWLMSVMLLGFLTRASVHDGSISIDTVDPLVVVTDSFPNSVMQVTEEYTKDEGEKHLSIEDKLALQSAYSTPEQDAEITLGSDESHEMKRFPYAIDSPSSIVDVSVMLSYCVYDESLSFAKCKKFWRDTCEGGELHFKLDNLNAVTVCKNEGRVYVAFAGTQSYNDIIADAQVFSQRMSYNKKVLFAHGGFVERSRRYKKWVMETLSGIQGIKQKEIILTGHSLGAAQATLLAHDVYEGLGLDVHGGIPNALNQVKVIGYASPSLMLDSSSYFLGHLNHLRFYNPNDPVATTFAGVSGYSHVGVQLATSDGPTGHISRAVPLLAKQNSLKLLHDLPYSYWKSLPPLARSRFNPGFDTHTIDSYTITAVPAFEEYQNRRDSNDRSLTALVNVEQVLKKRINAPVTCKLQNNKVICVSNKKIIAKFRYALDALPTGQEMDACMSSIVNNNFISGLTVNAGISPGKNLSPMTAASEALVLDISAEDKWHKWMTSRMLADLYLDGNTPFPDICERKPTLLESTKTLSTERALIRKYIDSTPRLFTVTKNHATLPDETVELIQRDANFFSDNQQESWMDCRLPENNIFCPIDCTSDNQACAMMKKWNTEEEGSNYWVSLSKNANMKWTDDINSWKYTIKEKGTNSWFSIWRSQSQATLMVVRDNSEDYLQFVV